MRNATLKLDDKVGSIHRLSADILNKISNNGWTYWHKKDADGKLFLIDDLRDIYIKNHLN